MLAKSDLMAPADNSQIPRSPFSSLGGSLRLIHQSCDVFSIVAQLFGKFSHFAMSADWSITKFCDALLS